jgi:glycosyltransferase involved in cell wall biosynthesis
VKILHVIPSFVPAWGFGGPIHALFELTREQRHRGHSVTVMTTNVDVTGVLDVPLSQPTAINDVEVWYFPLDLRAGTLSFGLYRGLGTQVDRFDLVHIHSIFNFPSSFAAHWARRKRVPYIVRPCGSLSILSSSDHLSSAGSWAKKWMYLKTLAKLDLGQAAAIHCTSDTEEHLTRMIQPHARYFVTPLGVRVPSAVSPEGRSIRGRFKEFSDRTVILYLSRLAPGKGLELLLGAAAKVAHTRDDFVLAIAGDGDRQYEQHLSMLVRRLNLDKRTIFLGGVFGDAKMQTLTAADIFVLTSYHENFGLAVAEAMAAGLPVVVSDRVSLHREIEHAGAGIIVTLEIGSISEALERLLDHQSLRCEMGRKARELATRAFNWSLIVDRLTALYAEIVISNKQGVFSS